MAQTTFSFGQPDADEILAEKGDGQNGRLKRLAFNLVHTGLADEVVRQIRTAC